jgi:hypothetical protein
VTIAQLADGVTFAQAEEEVHAIVADLARELPLTHQGWTGGLNTFRAWQYGTFRAPLLVLFIAVLYPSGKRARNVDRSECICDAHLKFRR